MANKLEGKIAVITGGGSDIGLATAKRLVEGTCVFIIDRHKRDLDLALSGTGKNVVGIEGDVSNLTDLDKLYNIVVRGSYRVVQL